jgi:exodeoxyribonuclease VII large subunit
MKTTLLFHRDDRNKALSLYEVLEQVKLALKNALPPSWWVMGEISELKVNYSGHCYLELIEKDDSSETIKAKARATIWASAYRMIQPYFESVTHTTLSAGIKVMVKVSAEFHELYGFSLNITDIEPSYTIGELARQKQEIINRLQSDGVFDMNRSLMLPLLPRKIAVISSKTAAGLGDFMDQLADNPYGYKFYIRLFPAIMQGDDAEQSITRALEDVYRHENFFDVVVIIRGGGSQSDLNCFNNYMLASHICQFPLPILTGIGHEQDDTIADLVAHTRLKTPTAVAEFLIGLFQEAEASINEKSLDLFQAVSSKIREEQERLHRLMLLLKPSVMERLQTNASDLRMLQSNLKNASTQLLIKEQAGVGKSQVRLKILLREFMSSKKYEVELLEKKNNYLDPFLILNRGYSVTYYNGKVLKDPSQVSKEDVIETKLALGNLKSKKL